MEPTVKVTLTGELDRVEAVAERIRQLFTVTYESKDRETRLSDGIIRYLRVLSPGPAHQLSLSDPARPDQTRPDQPAHPPK